MAVTVQTLEKLERKITLTLPTSLIEDEVNARLKKLAKKVKMDGFRPGKVPMKLVAERYGYSVQYEVMNDKVGEAFRQAANEANLRVAGQPKISESETSSEGALSFDAVFEVFPEIQIKDLTTASIKKAVSSVSEQAVQKTIDLLLKQRRTFAAKEEGVTAVNSDRVTVDFEGKIDAEPFEGGSSQGFSFILGEGQMLQEFEQAVLGMRVGESKTFPLAFPEDYRGKDVAGKTADFMVTLKQIEGANTPELTDELAQSLGVEGATVQALRDDVQRNLERELKFRLAARNKQQAMDVLLTHSEFDLPVSIVQAELDRMVQAARDDLKQRGIKGAEQAPIPTDVFKPQAERRVRLGLVVSELVRSHNLQAKQEQINAHIHDLASSYEKPEEVLRWYYSDNRRIAEVEGIVIEQNVSDYVFAHATVEEVAVQFDELMGSQ